MMIVCKVQHVYKYNIMLCVEHSFNLIVRLPTLLNISYMCTVHAVSFLTAGLTEFERRAQFITGNNHQHVYEPLMKRCLSKHPVARGTFEDVKKDLSFHLSKYGGSKAQKLEEQIVSNPALSM